MKKCNELEELKSQLSQLSLKQLKELSKTLQHPFKSNISKHIFAHELYEYFRFKKMWQVIVNT